MSPRSTMRQAAGQAPLACLTALALLLAGCGGGSGTDGGTDGTMSDETAQGNAADAAVMPVTAATGLETASIELQTALATTASAAATLLQPQAVQANSAPTVTVACANGGTVAWTISGGSLANQLNGQLDAGETYSVTFTACGGATPGVVLDGALSLAVTAFAAGSADLNLLATGLQVSLSQGRFVLDGGARWQASSSATADGGSLNSAHLTSSGLALAATLAGRSASYSLTAMDWTVQRTLNAAGELGARSQQGSLALAASTVRRPAATLQITSAGALTLGSDGWVAGGSFSATTAGDRLDVVYGSGSVTVSLDLGNDGTVDRGWVLDRSAFDSLAG